MAVKLQRRRGTAAAWTGTNPILLEGEIGLETDTLKLKVGDGASAWNSLPYYNVGTGGVVSDGVVDPIAAPTNTTVSNWHINTATGTAWIWPAGGAAWQQIV